MTDCFVRTTNIFFCDAPAHRGAGHHDAVYLLRHRLVLEGLYVRPPFDETLAQPAPAPRGLQAAPESPQLVAIRHHRVPEHRTAEALPQKSVQESCEELQDLRSLVATWDD